ncbi:MAG: PhoH family protein [Rhodospirillaceae bacterium]
MTLGEEARLGSPNLVLRFRENRLLPVLFGEHDRNLVRIEEALRIRISSRGNRVSLSGEKHALEIGQLAINALYQRLEGGLPVDTAEVDAALRLASVDILASPSNSADAAIITPKRHISPRSSGQVRYIRALSEAQIVFGIGPAGTGKTYLAVAKAVSCLMSGRVDRIILSRPAVEAGERLGFLPGDMREKIDPYLAPLYDALYDMMPAEQVANRISSGEIEVAPLAFMRGRTLGHAFIILDEAQNATRTQMKMFLTRLGERSQMVINGDPSQVDLPERSVSGLMDAVKTLRNIKEIKTIQFCDQDIVRHNLVTEVVRAYEADNRRQTHIEPENGH